MQSKMVVAVQRNESTTNVPPSQPQLAADYVKPDTVAVGGTVSLAPSTIGGATFASSKSVVRFD